MAPAQIHIYTDGSALGNPGPGGYGIIIELVGKQYFKEYAQGFAHTTNNRMELLAVIVGLETLKKQPMDVVVFSDSKYVIDSVEKKWVFGWKAKNFKGKKNPDLWKRFLTIYRERQGTPEAVAEAQGLRDYLVRASLPLHVDALRTSDVVIFEIWRDSPSWA